MASISYAIVTGKSSSAEEGVLILRGDLDETIKEQYMSWDRPLTLNSSLNFYIEKGKPLFNFAPGILDDINVYFRLFYQSGKRYTEYIFTGNYDTDGRPEYAYDRTNVLEEIGDNWFWIDMNIEKYFNKASIQVFRFEHNDN